METFSRTRVVIRYTAAVWPAGAATVTRNVPSARARRMAGIAFWTATVVEEAEEKAP